MDGAGEGAGSGWFPAAVEAAGLKGKITFHGLRHLFAVRDWEIPAHPAAAVHLPELSPQAASSNSQYQPSPYMLVNITPIRETSAIARFYFPSSGHV
jgi:hypothetical protein